MGHFAHDAALRPSTPQFTVEVLFESVLFLLHLLGYDCADRMHMLDSATMTSIHAAFTHLHLQFLHFAVLQDSGEEGHFPAGS